ncbi:MAG: ribonuclease III [Planctomycetota bacterium]
MDERLRLKLEGVLGHTFRNPRLLQTAVTHASLRKVEKTCNERLEFLGDAALGLVVTQLIYRKYPSADEGELTRLKSNLVSRRTLAIMIRELKLQNALQLGPGVPDALSDALLANLFESLVGALYLDAGMRKTRSWLEGLFRGRVTIVELNRHERDHKSILQQLAQKAFRSDPGYTLLGETGPDHEREFRVDVEVGGSRAEGLGRSKKAAERQAAAALLRVFRKRKALREILSGIQG